jgi:transposase
MSDDERKELIRLRKENERLCKLLEKALKGNAELREQLKDLQEKLDILLVRMNKRNRKDFGSKTERHNPRPAVDGLVEAQRRQPSSSANDAPKGIKHILNQPVNEVAVQHSVCDADRFCPECCVETVFVGNNISHQLEKIASTIQKLRHLQEVRSCPKCKTYMVTAEKPCAPIPGSYAGPGLLADTIVGKFGDGLPLNRKSKMFKRERVVIPRSTQSDWIIASSLTVEPLYELLKREVLCSAIIQTDDSELKVQDRKHKRKMRKGKITVYRGDRDHRYVVFDFSGDKSFERNKLFFEDFKGIVQADAANGFDAFFADGTKTEAGCNAHARRRFFDCLPVETKVCNEILDLYDQIYKIEK